MPRPGGRPVRAVNACTPGTAAARISAPIAAPSISLAAMHRTRARFRGLFELFEALGAPEHDEIVARVHLGFRLGIEGHLAVGAPDADDDHPEALAQAGGDQAAARERRLLGDVDLLEIQ